MQNNRGGNKPQPWNVYRLKELPANREGEIKTDFQQCGVAWPMKESEGFNVDLHFALPEGTRIAIMPRKQQGGR